MTAGRVYQVSKSSDTMEIVYKKELLETKSTFNTILSSWEDSLYQKSLIAAIYHQSFHVLLALQDYAINHLHHTFPSTDVKLLDRGTFNIVVQNTKENEILRICDDPKIWNKASYELLQNNKNTGFAPIIKCVEERVLKTYTVRYNIIPLLKPIDENAIDDTKMSKCVHNVIDFLSKHQEYNFTDTHMGNFMQSIDEKQYYISDIDIDMSSNSKIPEPNIVMYEEQRKLGKPIKISYNMSLYVSICAKFHVECNNFTCSLIALTLFELAKWNHRIIITDEVEKKLFETMSKYFPIDGDEK